MSRVQGLLWTSGEAYIRCLCVCQCSIRMISEIDKIKTFEKELDAALETMESLAYEGNQSLLSKNNYKLQGRGLMASKSLMKSTSTTFENSTYW